MEFIKTHINLKSLYSLFVFALLMIPVGCAQDTESADANDSGHFSMSISEFYTQYNVRCMDQVVYYSGQEHSTFNKSKALGPPQGAGQNSGSLDVFNLGEGQSAIFTMQGYALFDGSGADFIVYENGFQVHNSGLYSLDFGYVEVSPGGTSTDPSAWDWYLILPVHSGPPDNEQGGKSNLVGLEPVSLHFPGHIIDPRDEKAGGDRFDLSMARKIENRHNGSDPRVFTLGHTLAEDHVTLIKYIKIVDGGQYFPDAQDYSNGVDIDGICALYIQKAE